MGNERVYVCVLNCLDVPCLNVGGMSLNECFLVLNNYIFSHPYRMIFYFSHMLIANDFHISAATNQLGSSDFSIDRNWLHRPKESKLKIYWDRQFTLRLYKYIPLTYLWTSGVPGRALSNLSGEKPPWPLAKQHLLHLLIGDFSLECKWLSLSNRHFSSHLRSWPVGWCKLPCLPWLSMLAQEGGNRISFKEASAGKPSKDKGSNRIQWWYVMVTIFL